MPINPEAVGATSDPWTSSWTSKDSLLYALGVGCGMDDLAFTTENSMNVTQRALPTMVVTLADVSAMFARIGPFNPFLLVHGEQRITLHREVPPVGTITSTAEITAIWDKGKGAVVEVTARSVDGADGKPLFDTVMSAFLRGEGGWGGDRGPSGPRNAAPEREPDHVVDAQTSVDQALLYRLSGDRNPLHSDPSFAAVAGFDRPILHGLCTYGFTGRALLASVCGNDPARLHHMEGRFSSPVMPGERLSTSVWRTADDEAVFSTSGGDGRAVIDSGLVRFS